MNPVPWRKKLAIERIDHPPGYDPEEPRRSCPPWLLWMGLLWMGLPWLGLLCGCLSNSPPEDPQANEPPANPMEVAPPNISQQAPQIVEGTNQPPVFPGPSAVIAGDGIIDIHWKPALDDQTTADRLRYTIHTAGRSGKQDLTDPLVITEAGSSSYQLQGLPAGEAVYLVVQAIDEQGLSDGNKLEWAALPNPVIYVDASAATGGDGSTPAKALKKIDEAIGAAIGYSGVNIHIAEGRYPEQFLLFEGMSIYGGFPSNFTGPADPQVHVTEIVGVLDKDTIIVPPGDQLVVIDGMVFHGRQEVRRAVIADDCQIRLSRCKIDGFRDKGIQIETDLDLEGAASGVIQSCVISSNGGDGIRIEGHVDLAIRDCTVIDNRQSGVSVLPLLPRHGEKTRIEMERCRVSRNQDIGISIKIDPPSQRKREEDDPQDARIRIALRGVLVEGNHDHGVSIDVQYAEEATADLRIRVEQCSFRSNHKSGLHIDADAPGDLSVGESEFLGNQGESGLRISGDARDALIRVHSCFFAAQPISAVRLQGQGCLLIHRCLLVDNLGPALIVRDKHQVRALVSDSVVIGPDSPGVRTERVHITPGDDRWHFVTVEQSTSNSLHLVGANSAPLKGGFLHDLLGKAAIAVGDQQPNGWIDLREESSPPPQKGSIWLRAPAAEEPTWKQVVANLTGGEGSPSLLDSHADEVRPGINRVGHTPKRPLAAISVVPVSGALMAGVAPVWVIQLSEQPVADPSARVFIDGQMIASSGTMTGDELKIRIAEKLAPGNRIRIEWTDSSDSSLRPSSNSHEWFVIAAED